MRKLLSAGSDCHSLNYGWTGNNDSEIKKNIINVLIVKIIFHLFSFRYYNLVRVKIKNVALMNDLGKFNFFLFILFRISGIPK